MQFSNFLYIILPTLIFTSTFSSYAAENPEADELLPIEDLLTSENQWTFSLATIYANSETTGAVVGETTLVQTGPGQFVTVPVDITQKRTNNDTLILVPTLRYGLTKDTQLSIHTSLSASQTRTQGQNGIDSDSSTRFADTWIGIDHRFRKEGDSPGFFAFLETSLAENLSTDSTDLAYGKSWLVGATFYRAIDPILMNLNTALQISLERESGGQDIDPGDFLSISPTAHFLPNRDIALSFGFNWTIRDTDKVDGKKISFRTTRTDLSFGFDYAVSKQSIFFVSLNTNISGGTGSSVGVTWNYEFEKMTK